MAATYQPVCPVVGTTNTILPPTHPSFDISKPGQVCPVTNASTDHHQNLSQHPPVNNSDEKVADAGKCPALKDLGSEGQQKELDESVCPVVGPVTTILPPDHPSVEEAAEDAACPVTKAVKKHHKGKVIEHPKVVSDGTVCPVTGKSGSVALAHDV